MKVLCLSDIHGNEWFVDAMLEHINKNKLEFDCVVVGGDIVGKDVDISNIFSEKIELTSVPDTDNTDFIRILTKLAGLGKEVFYCLGNWDNKVPYEIPELPTNCHHVHNEVFEFQGFYFSGFSSCDFDWGQNPIALHTGKVLIEKYGDLIEQHNLEVVLSKTERSKKIESLEKVSEKYEYYRTLATIKYTDKRKKPYQKAIRSLSFREQALKDRAYSFQSQSLKKLRSSARFQQFLEEKTILTRDIEKKNIHKILRLLKEKNVPLSRLFFLSHAKIDRFAENFDETPFCHLFGHRHGFMSSYRRIRGEPESGRTNYINISALDLNRPRTSQFYLPPNFVIAELNGSDRITAKPIYLELLDSNLPVPEEDKPRVIATLLNLFEYYEYEKDRLNDCQEMLDRLMS